MGDLLDPDTRGRCGSDLDSHYGRSSGSRSAWRMRIRIQEAKIAQKCVSKVRKS